MSGSEKGGKKMSRYIDADAVKEAWKTTEVDGATLSVIYGLFKTASRLTTPRTTDVADTAQCVIGAKTIPTASLV